MQDTPADAILIRPARTSDVPAIQALIKPFVAAQQLLARTDQEIEWLATHGFAAVSDQHLVGFAAVEIYSRKLAEIQCLAVAAESGLSRLPVRRADGRNLAGWLLVRDLLLRLSEPGDTGRRLPADLVRTCLLVDVRMTPHELFEEFHDRRQQLAVVVDADGEVLGLITLEDLVETVVGSIEDEFDR